MGDIRPDFEEKRQEILKACKKVHEKEQEEVVETIGKENVQLVLCFRLNEQLYGVEIEQIREIAKNVEIYPVPGTKEFVLGVINIRGEICAVIDPLMRLGKGKIKIEDNNASKEVIIFKNLGEPLAIVVDEVTDLIEAHISLDTNTLGIVKGKAKILKEQGKENIVGILDPEKLFFNHEISE